jgi:hypothetical protein
MQIREIFAAPIQERIEPIVKVADRSPSVVYNELTNLVVTPQWERYIHRVLDAYTDAAERDNEQGIGVWISGFFGSGKSLLMKVLGVLLAGGDLNGRPVHDIFLDRLPPDSQDLGDIRRFLAICKRKIATTAVGGNLHSMLTAEEDRLPLIAFKLFAEQRGYSHNWPLAWGVEYQIDEQGKTDAFRESAADLAGVDWDEIAIDPEFYLDALYQAAATVLPGNFASPADVERAANAVSRSGIDAGRVIRRLRRWCEGRDQDGIRHKLFLQLDELGQWIAAGNANDRTMQVQALVEEAAERGGGRIWLPVTAHGDVQALQQNIQQEYYAKIIQRFALQCKLSNEDISQVVEQRVLSKTQPARNELAQRFNQRSGEIVDMGRVEAAQRIYPAPDAGSFATYYPYMPWTVTVIPDVVKGVAQAANRDEALTGSNRTMIAVVQGALIETPDLLNSQVGRLVPLAHLYSQLSSDVPVETKTDLSRISQTVPQATPFTTQVAYGLFLLGQAEYIPTTIDNVARTLVDSLEAAFAPLRRRVKEELDRLVAAGYAKLVGDRYLFLNTQQRSFQDKIRARQTELLGQSYTLSQKLQEHYGSESALRFERVPLLARDMAVQVELDGKVVRNPTSGHVRVHVYSPFQRAMDPQIGDDAAMRQRSAQEPNSIFLRMGEVSGFRDALALAVATDEIATQTIAQAQTGSGEAGIARQAVQQDLSPLQTEVRRLLGQSVRTGVIFFRGAIYQLAAADSAGEAVLATLSQILPAIYPRLHEMPHRIANETAAVRAALANNTSNADLRTLEVYRADGTLNETHPLLVTLRSQLPLADQDQEPINAADLRRHFEEPPFGWDGNCVKVGLALLLRASGCRLIDAGQPITDPASPRAVELLTTDASFRKLRVQGVRVDLTVTELRAIRDRMRPILAIPANTALVPATLSAVLSEALTALAGRAHAVQEWSATIQFPLPHDFATGVSLVQELLNTGAGPGRLLAFQNQGETLHRFTQSLAALELFRSEQSDRFQAVRDFFTSMVNAGADLAAVRTFVEDYRTLTRDRTLADAERWRELCHAHQAAQTAVDEQIAAWRVQASDHLARLNADLEAAVRTAGVPEEQVRDEAAALSGLYDDVRNRLERDAHTFGEARGLLALILRSDDSKTEQLRELRTRYQVKPPPPHRLAWRDLLPTPLPLTSEAELDQFLADLRAHIAPHLGDEQGVIIE